MLVITKKQILKFCFAIIAVVMLAGVVSVANFKKNETVNLNVTDWGLSYREEGKTPVGNADKDFLKKYNSYFVGDENQKVIYLTFDCGFEAGYTEKMLDILKKHNVKSTFFVVGNYLTSSPDIVKRMEKEGHIVANHTYSHPDMSKISDEKSFKEELLKTEAEYEKITGKKMQKFYRPPRGKFSENNLKMANNLGYKTIFWSLAYVDWYQDKQPSKDEAFSKLIPRMHPGSIVLLHNTSKTNGEILDELLTKWKEMGYKFKNLNEL